MKSRADSIRVMCPLFQEGEGGSIPTSALQLHIERIPYDQARDLNRKWHSRLPRIGDPACIMKAAICYGAEFDGVIYATAIWSHPVNRSLPQTTWLELRRMAVAHDAPRNTPSRMLAVMTRILKKQNPELEKLMSYQDTEVHAGTIYRAAGWIPVQVAKPASWTNRKRVRPKDQSLAQKIRWEKEI